VFSSGTVQPIFHGEVVMSDDLTKIWDKRLNDICDGFMGQFNSQQTLINYKHAMTDHVRRVYLEGGCVIDTITGEPIDSPDDVDVIVEADGSTVDVKIGPTKDWLDRKLEILHRPFAEVFSEKRGS
jgi:hypothetical protein